ncbi:MAG TPA: hypothetical protein VFG42_08435 [Baekduia sp.]|uniref:hypothetical protein n=1 Tax=Baekduia sp. TaxID=2600305 RepID=UPI002D7809D0|nr:hypothetical protein [Baekduia sp.]HET6506803.1 hypothetical protein [Baekduia sp.]
MRRLAAIAVLAGALAVASPAAALARDGVEIGGTVDATLGLTVLDDGPSVFHTEITSTVDATRLTVAGSPGLGVTAAVGSVFQPLGVPIDPLLRSWSGPLASEPVTISVGGHAKTSDPYLLITVSAQTP